MIKKILLTVCFFAAVGLFFYSRPKKRTQYKIGILQTASHPALNQIKEQLLFDLKEKYQDDITIVLKNGEGNISHIDLIAKQFVNDADFHLYVAIATPALQALAKVEKKRPIVIGAVTDLAVIGLGEQKNICGFLDKIDLPAVIQSLKKLFSDKKIAVLYSTGDLSSQYTVEALEKSDLLIERFGCVGEVELIAQVQRACQLSDLLFLPTDNTLAGAVKMIIDVAKKQETPLFMTDLLLFKLGGQYAQGIDYQKQGKEMAKAISLLLEKKNNPEEIGVNQSSFSGLLMR